MPDSSHQRYSHKMFEPAPWTISESNHCNNVFEKLRLQREQGRFCDVILKVNSREFPAHRCVLASCSSVFDRKFNVHKTMKESIEVENVKNYEVFHLVLTYMYTGKISLEKQTVADILDIAHLYSITKLKNYCSEFMERYLRLNNCLKVAELSTRYHLVDLSKQTMSFINKNFKQILQFNEIDKKSSLQEFLSYHQSLWLPAEIVLRLIMRWISQDQERREEQFVSLLNNVNWTTLDPNYLTTLLEDFKLGQESFLTLLSTLIKNSIPLEERFNKIYQELQERFFSNCHDFEQELDDNNSFLSFAINTAVKDLENQDVAVDETFSSYIFQQESLPETVPQYNYRPHQQSSELGYKPAMVDNSALIGMDSSYVTPNTVHETNIQVKSGSKVEQAEAGEFIPNEEHLKTPLRISTNFTDQPSSMMFHGPKVMMTPDNSAASSPIAQSIPSPVNSYKPLVVGQSAEYSYRGVDMYQPGPSMYREEQDMYRVQPPTYTNMESYRTTGWMGESDTGLQRPDYNHGQHYRTMDPGRGDTRNINKQGFDFISEYQMIEQVINEQEENTKFPATKRYDPKHRALAQAFRKKDPSMETENYFSVKHQHLESCSISKSEQQIQFDPIHQADTEQCKVDFKQCQYSRPMLQRPELVSSSSPRAQPSHHHNRQESSPSSSFIEPEPDTSHHLSTCAPDPLQTPEKSEFYPSQSSSCLPSEDTEQARVKPEPQQLFLTPKEKYAKEVSAQNQNCPPPQPPPIVSFDLNQGLDTEKAPSEARTVEARTVFPSAIKILKSKKKMASQKRLILEHGEVRLTQRQRIKMKKKSRRLRAKDIFQPSEEPVVSYLGYGEETADTDSPNADDSPKKIIVNRKDKLLAEHRSQNQSQASPESESKMKNSIKCSKCSFSCATPHKLKVHEKVHKENKQYSCPFCSFTCYWIKDHYHHIQTRHITGPPPYKCPRCAYQNSRVQQVLAHQTCHSESMPFICQHENCTFRTKSSHNLRKHEKNHSQEKFNCETCGKSFAQKSTLEQHQAVHTDEKKFKCKICPYSSKYSSHLAAHRRVHEGRVHRCTFDGCQYWTPKGTLLKAHIRAHNGDKCFKCETCGKGFVEAGQLRRHMKTHSTAKPFSCNIDNCPYVTNRRDKLKEHQARSHKAKENFEQNEAELKKRPSKLILNVSASQDSMSINFD